MATDRELAAPSSEYLRLVLEADLRLLTLTAQPRQQRQLIEDPGPLALLGAAEIGVLAAALDKLDALAGGRDTGRASACAAA